MPGPVDDRRAWPAVGALVAFALLGVGLVVLYPDSYQQDGGTHFLFARWAWHYPSTFVDVWGRPLFTALYSVPARLGYPAAKLFTVAICLATAWHTWRLAGEEGLDQPWLAIPLLWLQPSFMLVSADTLTEPLFALLLVIALRLQHAGRVSAAAIVVSATPLTRPEGFFICTLWAAWLMAGPGATPRIRDRLWPIACLALGTLTWWAAADIITWDPLFILHNWPSNWSASGATYGKGPLLDYYHHRGEILGPLFILPFGVGVVSAVARRRLGLVLAMVIVFAVVHSLLRYTGAFGTAGYPRYFACVAPALALLTLAGWNEIVTGMRFVAGRYAGPVIGVATAIVLGYAAVMDLTYLDDMPWTRDARMIAQAQDWWGAHERPVSQFVYSQAYMCIRFECDPHARDPVHNPRAVALSALRSMPLGTLIFWDADTGPAFFDGVTADSIIALGYTPLWTASDTLRGRFLPHLANGRYILGVHPWGWGTPRVQQMWLLYR